MPAVRWRGEIIPLLVLGTAQLGLPGYGVANASGAIDQEQADAIVKAAWDSGVRFFDTAQGYGDSEERLGRAFAGLGISAGEAGVVTKPDPGLDPGKFEIVTAELGRSLKRLRLDRLWGVMLHRFSWLECWDDGLGDCLKRFRDEGGAKYLGVSVYSPAEALAALAHPDMDIIQIPANAWDGRMVRAGVFERARKRDKLLLVRSVFLQGLLLLSPDEAEARVTGAGSPAAVWRELCRKASCPPLEAAIRWAAGLGFPLVVGVETMKQMEEIAQIMKGAGQAIEVKIPREVESEAVVNPSLWER
jgi:aryl-alcohol dehydrogenase-like predicted oxidoreductase